MFESTYEDIGGDDGAAADGYSISNSCVIIDDIFTVYSIAASYAGTSYDETVIVERRSLSGGRVVRECYTSMDGAAAVDDIQRVSVMASEASRSCVNVSIWEDSAATVEMRVRTYGDSTT